MQCVGFEYTPPQCPLVLWPPWDFYSVGVEDAGSLGVRRRQESDGKLGQTSTPYSRTYCVEKALLSENDPTVHKRLTAVGFLNSAFGS